MVSSDICGGHKMVHLRELFGDRVIALNHDVEWVPRTLNLTPCDFFLWGYLKNKVTPAHRTTFRKYKPYSLRSVDLCFEIGTSSSSSSSWASWPFWVFAHAISFCDFYIMRACATFRRSLK
jgi:hypothetical protein